MVETDKKLKNIRNNDFQQNRFWYYVVIERGNIVDNCNFTKHL